MTRAGEQEAAPQPSNQPSTRPTRSAVLKVAAFGAVLAVLFALAAGIGQLVATPAPAPAAPMSGDDMAGMQMSGMDGTDVPQGLLVSTNGYTVAVQDAVLPAGNPATMQFAIIGPDGRKVTSFTPHQEQLMHLIIVRRDLSGFQHLHPTMAPDGTWTQQLTIPDPGSYRAFVQFVTDTRELTLGVDLAVPGDFRPVALPAAAPTAEVDGYEVALTTTPHPGDDGTLAVHVTRAGQPVTDLQPYLGALGHLTAVRVGDLAFLHIHPRTSAGSGPDIAFAFGEPPAGTYRLFVQFRTAAVHTAEFTVSLA